MASHMKSVSNGVSRSSKNEDYLVRHCGDWLDCCKVTLDTDQPGELPLMRQVFACGKPTCPRKPLSVKVLHFGGRSRKSFSRKRSNAKDFVKRNAESYGGRGWHQVGRHSEKASYTQTLSGDAPPSLMDMEGIHFGFQNLALGGGNILCGFPENLKDDEFSLHHWVDSECLQNEACPSQKGDRRFQTEEQLSRHHRSHMRDVEVFMNPEGWMKYMPNKSNMRISPKPNHQILSPLILNSYGDSNLAGDHPLSLLPFRLGGLESVDQEDIQEVKMPGPYRLRSLSQDVLHTNERGKNPPRVPCRMFKTQKPGKTLPHSSRNTFTRDLSDLSRRKCITSSKFYVGPQLDTRIGVQCVQNKELREGEARQTGLSAYGDIDETSFVQGRGRPISDFAVEMAPASGSRERDFQEQDVSKCGSPLEGKKVQLTVKKPRTLSQKYRPQTFKDLIGQNFVAHALSNTILKGKCAPVYLFQGSHGTGKTSAARIFAAALNCASSGNKRPCGVCEECAALMSGKTLGVWEIDGVSHNEIGHLKELMEGIFSATKGPPYKIVIIDECHMLKNETWSFLLKLLEEPPENVVFILITTFPDKLPRIVVSRCQKFHFLRIKHLDIVDRLTKLLKLENLDAEPGALNLIASKAEGSLRDAETVLDQLSLLGRKITQARIHELAGSVSDNQLMNLLDSALCSDMVSMVRRTRELINSGVEPLDLMSQLAALISDILAGGNELMKRNQSQSSSFHALSDFEMERLQIALKVLLEAEQQLREVSHYRTTWLTAVLLQMGPRLQTKLKASTSSTSLSPATKSNKAYGLKAFIQQGEIKKGDLKTGIVLGRRGNASKVAMFKAKAQIHPIEHPSTHKASKDYLAKPLAMSPCSGVDLHFKSPGNLGSIWQNVLKDCLPPSLAQLLQNHARLKALTFSAVKAVAYLEFVKQEHKHKAEAYGTYIAGNFRKVLGLCVEVEMSLALSSCGIGFTCSHVATDDTVIVQSISKQCENLKAAQCGNAKDTQVVKSLQSGSSIGVPLINTVEAVNSLHDSPTIFTLPESIYPTHRVVDNLKGMTCSGAETGISKQQMHTFECWQQNLRVLEKEISERNLCKPINGLKAQKCPHDGVFDSLKDDKGSQASNFGEEIVKAEPPPRGFLCWKVQETDQTKVTNQQRWKRHGVSLRVVPCIKFKGH